MLSKEQAAKYMVLAWLKDWSVRLYLGTIYQTNIPEDPKQIHKDYPWMPVLESLYFHGRGRKYCRTFIAMTYPDLNNALCDAADNKALLALAPRILGLNNKNIQLQTMLRKPDYAECKRSQLDFQANRMMSDSKREERKNALRSNWGTVKGKCNS
jgi:hypothetical protein